MVRLLALVIAAIVVFIDPRVSYSQNLSDLMKFAQDPSQSYHGVGGGIGSSIFGGKPYFLINLAPQGQFGKFGIGIDGNLRIGRDGKLRKEDFDETYDYLRWINYLSWGQQTDTIYLRVGGLTRATLGHGTIIGGYSNNSSYDERRIGLAAALRLGAVGAEALVSDIFRSGLLAARPYIHPFQFFPVLSSIGLLSDIQLGFTGTLDYDSNAVKIIPNAPPYVTRYPRSDDPDEDSIVINDYYRKTSPLTIWGVDLSTSFIKSENLQLDGYGDYVKIVGFNDGFIIGAHSMMKLGEHLLDLRLERSLFKNGFLPNYYNSFYERDRFDNQADTNDYITKVTLLEDTVSGNGNGFKLGGFLSLESIVQGSLTYLHLDNLDGYDWMDLYLQLPEKWYGFNGSIGYSRKNITGVDDVFALDNRSLLQARVSIPLYSFLYGTINARWTFDRDASGRLVTQGMYEPKVDFVARF